MSLPALRYVFASDLAGWERLVALELANAHNGQTGACFPGVAELVSSSGASRSTVLRALKALTASGVVTSSRREENRNDCEYAFPGLAEWLETLGKGGRGCWKTGVTQTPVAKKTGVTQTPVRRHTDTGSAKTGVTQTPTFPPPNIQDNREVFNHERTPARVRAGGRSREGGREGKYEKKAAGKAAEKIDDEKSPTEQRKIITWKNPFETTKAKPSTAEQKPLSGTPIAGDAGSHSGKRQTGSRGA